MYVVLLSANNDNPDFRGFIIQARRMADDSPVGIFTVTSGATDQQTRCDLDVSDSDLCSYK